jgi:hypothetical protein
MGLNRMLGASRDVIPYSPQLTRPGQLEPKRGRAQEPMQPLASDAAASGKSGDILSYRIAPYSVLQVISSPSKRS